MSLSNGCYCLYWTDGLFSPCQLPMDVIFLYSILTACQLSWPSFSSRGKHKTTIKISSSLQCFLFFLFLLSSQRALYSHLLLIHDGPQLPSPTWGLSWPSFLKEPSSLLITLVYWHMALHSTWTFLVYLFGYLFIICLPPLECKLQET